MTIQSTVLIGNGVNRIIKDNPDERQISWKSCLEQMAAAAQHKVRDIDQKPLTLVFDELLLKNQNLSRNDLQYIAMGKTFTNGELDLNHALSCLSKNILTTNFCAPFAMYGCGFSPDHLDFAISTPLFPNITENTFSIFRGRKMRNKTYWNINGSSPTSTSITLGLRQYARYQNHISNYLFSTISYSKVKGLYSPLYRPIPDFEFEKSGDPYSWVDLFLRDHIHMVGLGMDYSESILWWLMTEKFWMQRKYPKYIGGLTYHHVEVEKPSTHERVKLNMLEDLGAKVNVVKAKDYKSGHLKIADAIKPGIVKLLKAKDYKGMYKLSLK
ncbi:hypothetical protein M2125_001771 [Polynucleobacter sphagniphilus]|uniref:hypothetical protein n=1 Tax=Polynucleobacter sphagniphilus TaxID=1743169 RepID=UPI002474BBE4|nr:hypothetical protein [Polynucleobacter sphagniphilus]MDH6241957.1 hypothetical protein [Polynucleobacter sphagniphilus]